MAGLEGRNVRMVMPDVAVDLTASAQSFGCPHLATAMRAAGARRMAQRMARVAALGEQLAFLCAPPEELDVLIQARAGSPTRLARTDDGFLGRSVRLRALCGFGARSLFVRLRGRWSILTTTSGTCRCS